jgi:hypothetical protein
MWACDNEMSDVALRILDFDCSPKQVSKYGDSALNSARKNNMVEVITKISRLYEID